MCRFCRVVAIALALSAGLLLVAPRSAVAAYAVPVTPIFVDRGQGYVYFTVYNGWDRTIASLFGKVYGYGLHGVTSPSLINNPDQAAMKVSLGAHRPGSYALYRFKTPENWTVFPKYTLSLVQENLFDGRIR